MEAEPLTIEGLAQTYPIPRGFAVVGGFLYAMFSGVHLDKLVPLTREQTENAVRVLKSIPREKSDIRDQAAVGAYLQNLRNLAYGQFCADEGSLVLRILMGANCCGTRQNTSTTSRLNLSNALLRKFWARTTLSFLKTGRKACSMPTRRAVSSICLKHA